MAVAIEEASEAREDDFAHLGWKLQVAVTVNFGWSAPAVRAGDYDGDGKIDLVVAAQQGTISVLRGLGDGKFSPPTKMKIDANLVLIEDGDLDGDGKLDLLVVGYWTYRVLILKGNGDAPFAPSSVVPMSGIPIMPIVTDLNSDGLPDILLRRNFSALLVLLQKRQH